MVKALSYVAIFQCRNGNVTTRGRKFTISNGLYAYVGSCGNACAARITRHLSKVINRFWHVDYLHDICNEVAVMVLPFREEDVAEALLGKFLGVSNFGNSDKRKDRTHLFRVGSSGESIIRILYVLSRAINEKLSSNSC